MAEKTTVGTGHPTADRLSGDTLETSRLMLEFLHAAYASRNADGDSAGDAGAVGAARRRDGTVSMPVSPHAIRAAIHVYTHGERTVGQLASGLGISYGWASRVVEELGAARYVTRERDADDRRVVRVRLNPAAREEVERAYQWRLNNVEEALHPLAESEREAVRVFLRRMTDLLHTGQSERP
jgi:DNA-binding MarR family transcriptional regulator